MPHRIQSCYNCLAYVLEGLLLTITAGFQIGENLLVAFTEQDWSRFMGPQGFTVGLLMAVVVLWGNGIVRERNEQKRRASEEMAREGRHKESMALQKENSDRLLSLTVESIKAKGMLSTAMNRLVDELSDRPCNVKKPLTPFSFDEKPPKE